MTMKAGKFSTSMRQIASMPSSAYSTVSTFLMQCSAKFAAAPPIEGTSECLRHDVLRELGVAGHRVRQSHRPAALILEDLREGA